MTKHSTSHHAADQAGSGPHTSPLLELRQVTKRFIKPLDVAAKTANLFTRSFGKQLAPEVVHAVDDVSLHIERGEVVGLVGESGCGKSTLGRMVTGLHSLTSGQRLWQGEDLDAIPAAQRQARQLAIQMVFQDPYASLNPRLRVADIIGEAPRVHGLVDRAGQNDFVAELLQRVGLSGDMLRRFPHQFSGGQRARVGIARALAVRPEVLVCDEAVAALDVSIQAQVLNLFMQLRDELDLTYLFISHDLGVVQHISDRVVIMYLGRVVESAPTSAVFAPADRVSFPSALPACDRTLFIGAPGVTRNCSRTFLRLPFEPAAIIFTRRSGKSVVLR